jgi:hypothetical protein
MSASTYRRIAIAVVVGGVLLVSPPAVSGGPLWDAGIAFGYVCVVLALCLYLFPVRGDGLPHNRLFGLTQHRLVGWLTLGAVSLHVVILLAAQPSVGRYLLFSAPIFMWCGIVALIATGVLVQTGLSTRLAMRRSPTTDRPVKLATLHLVLAAAMILAACAHIIGSGQLVGGALKTAIVLLLVALPLTWFAVRPRPRRAPGGLLRSVTHVAAVALIPLVPSSSTSRLLLEPVTRPAHIELNFPHEKHTSVNCAACHHNFVDRTGVLSCVECHRSNRPDLPRSNEATFHVFCRDCHSGLAVEGGVQHGPTRACSSCH